MARPALRFGENDDVTPGSVPPPGYTQAAIALHWLTAAFVIPLIVVGVVMANFKLGATGDLLYDLHRSTGTVLIALVAVRIFHRLRHKPPPLPPDAPAVQSHMAELVHLALYALLLAQPLVGWAATSAYRAPIIVFWLFELPPIWPIDRAMSEWLFGLHRLLGIVMAALVCTHAGAALFHHFIRRDRVLQRMLGR